MLAILTAWTALAEGQRCRAYRRQVCNATVLQSTAAVIMLMDLRRHPQMIKNNKLVQAQALCLMTGGLNSQLAVCLLKEQGLQVHGLTLSHPLFDPAKAVAAAARLNISHEVREFSAPLIHVLSDNEESGDPSGRLCLLYHVAMLSLAREMMEDLGFDFVCTGGVLNQGLLSQTADAFLRMDKTSGCAGRVVRPLSAGRLPATEAERRGWIQRERLLDLEGPSRDRLLALAEQYGLPLCEPDTTESYFTDSVFAGRVRDLRQHEGFQGIKALRLLRLGRHFRIGPTTKLVVGRNEHENARLEGMTELYDLLLKVEQVPGPSGLIPFTATDSQVEKAAAICLRYSDAKPGQSCRVRIRSPRESRWLDAVPATPEEVATYRIDPVP